MSKQNRIHNQDWTTIILKYRDGLENDLSTNPITEMCVCVYDLKINFLISKHQMTTFYILLDGLYSEIRVSSCYRGRPENSLGVPVA